MLRIRLRRVGKKGKPSYRIVVAEAAAPRDGAYLEWIGNYDPMVDPPAVTLKKERAVQWLSRGAQPSDAVRRILDNNGILERTSEYGVRQPPPTAAEGVPGQSPNEDSGSDQSHVAVSEESNGGSPPGEQTDEARPE